MFLLDQYKKYKTLISQTVQAETKTTCPYCGVGCGVIVTALDKGFSVRGDEEHPANFGRLCSKGSALAETLDSQGRLLNPQINGTDTSWSDAIDHVASGFKKIIQEHGPNAVAIYASGQLLTEDYYVANKLMKGAIGSANIDTNSRLCMASAVVGYKRALGGDIVPCSYSDIDQANLIVLVGSNLAWCHPILYQRIIQARKERPEMVLVVIDPRRTATCQDAELHLPIKPGTDAVLFNGLLVYLAENNCVDQEYINNFCDGFEATLASAKLNANSIEEVARTCGLSERLVQEFYELFASNEKTLSLFSQGVNQSTVGTDKVNAIINVHLATGRIAKTGAGPFSITGQPNAMGGREVGGLANQLAAHMNFDTADIDKVQRFWQSDVIAQKPGLKAVDLFNAVADGTVKAVWIMSTNPAASMPNASKVRDALKACDLVVVSDCMEKTDTTECANVLFPAMTWGEKSGTVTNSERTISRQRGFIKSIGNSKPDWWIVTEVAKAMGYKDLFPFQNVADIFREHASLSGFENLKQRAFDISYYSAVNDEDYDNLIPFQWPKKSLSAQDSSQSDFSEPRLFSDNDFYTPNRRAQFIPINSCGTHESVDDEFPLSLNTGRIRDQWHTMTRTGKSARLFEHISESYVEIHPLDAKKYHIKHLGLVDIISRYGQSRLKAKISDDVQPGEVFVPMHWNAQFSSAGAIDTLVNPHTDSLSGQPEFKFTPVKLAAVEINWSAFILTRENLDLSQFDYWSRTVGKDCDCIQVAGLQAPNDWTEWGSSMVNPNKLQSSLLTHVDEAQGQYRFTSILNGRLEAVAYASQTDVLPNLTWIKKLFNLQELAPGDQHSLLLGESLDGDAGPIICSCFSVGRHTLVNAIIDQQLLTPEAIGQALRAGTNCGSCIPELRNLIQINTRAN